MGRNVPGKLIPGTLEGMGWGSLGFVGVQVAIGGSRFNMASTDEVQVGRGGALVLPGSIQSRWNLNLFLVPSGLQTPSSGKQMLTFSKRALKLAKTVLYCNLMKRYLMINQAHWENLAYGDISEKWCCFASYNVQ